MLESLPSLVPTDNLYKFLSIAGLAIFSFCFFYPDYRSYQISEKKINYKSEENILKYNFDVTMKKYKEYIDEMKSIREGDEKYFKSIDILSEVNIKKLNLDQLKKYRDKLNNSGKKLEKSHKKIEYIYNLSKKYDPIIDSLSIIEIKLDSVRELINNDINRINKLNNVSLFGQIIGAIMSITGFICWFLFIQRPQDIAVEKQVKNLL